MKTPCTHPGCPKKGSKRKAGGLCTGHAYRRSKGLPMDTPWGPRRSVYRLEEVCKVPGCTRHPEARDYCRPHYQRWRTGKPMGPPLRERGRPRSDVRVSVKVPKLVAKSLADVGERMGRTYEQVAREVLTSWYRGRRAVSATGKHPYEGDPEAYAWTQRAVPTEGL